MNAQRNFFYMLDHVALQERQRSLTFTDNTIVGVPDLSDEAFFVACFSAASYQLGMTLTGVAFRGGMAQGPLYVGESLAHETALMEAVNLEQAASYPRVMLSPQLRARAQVMPTLPVPEGMNEEIIQELIAFDEDGEMLVDYLGALSRFSIYSEYDLETFDEVLSRHADVVREALAIGQAREKWPWVADYHNSVVDRQGRGPQIEAARADDELVRTFTSWQQT